LKLVSVEGLSSFVHFAMIVLFFEMESVM